MGLKMMPEHPQMSKLNSMKTGMSYKKHKMGSDDSMKSSAKGKSSSDMMGKGQMMMMGGGPMGSYKGDAPSTMKKRMMMTYFKGKGTGEVYPEEEFPKCGCSECDETVWMTPVDEGNVRTCGEKIMELQTAGYGGHYEIEACTIISYLYPSTCGPYCNPNLCGKVEASAEPTLAPTIKPTNPPIVDNRDTLSPTAPPVVETPEPTPSPTTLPTKSPTTSPTKSPTIPPITTTSPPTTKESEETPSPTESPTTSPTVATTSRCGCDLCTNEVLDTEFEGFTCRTRIDFVISEGGLSEDAACTLIANSIEVCRPCHPSCGEDTPSLLPSGAPSDSSSPSLPPSETPTTKSPTNVPTKSPTHSPTKSPTDSPTLSPTLSPTIVDPSTSLDTCACPGCDDVLDVFVDGISCGDRILFAQSEDGGGLAEEQACAFVGTSFPDNCGACNPDTCHNDNTGGGGNDDDRCGCPTCTPEVLDTSVDGISCGLRIAFFQSMDGGGLSELEACRVVASDFPNACGACSPCRRRN